MALSAKAIKSLSGLWGSYDFNLIRDKHFKTASDMVERFLEVYQKQWIGSSRPIDSEFVRETKHVRNLLTGWAEKKLAVVTANDSIQTIQSNIMFKQLHYGRDSISFGANGTSWKKKVEIADELKRYKPWSVAHAVAKTGGKATLRQQMESIIQGVGSSSEHAFFKGWWELTDNDDRPMLFPQVCGHTSGKLWLPISKERVCAAFFSFGLVNVANKSKILIQCEPHPSKFGVDAKKTMMAKQNLAANAGWLVFQFSHAQLANNLQECFDSIEDYLHY